MIQFRTMKVNIKNALIALSLCMVFLPAKAEEGMWLPFLLQNLNEARMKELGLQLSATDIYDVNNSSLKDAIVHFGGGCTSELISSEGLLLTNHHCGYGQIQKHSSVDNDLLKDGFWAMNRSEELKNPGLDATFVRFMEDVTSWIIRDIPENANTHVYDSITEFNIENLLSKRKDPRGYKLEIVPLFYGNQYIIIGTETFNDVRLVGAPPSSIGKYGADTDNWMWPRHTGDFSLFRIYANAENKPSELADDNVPYRTDAHLKISMDGVHPGDFTMVFGFPGYTQEYLPGAGVRQVVEIEDPLRIAVRDIRLEEMDVFMRKDDATRIKYAAQYASISNGWKKWIGEIQGVEISKGLERKAKKEAEFRKRLMNNAKHHAAYSGLLEEFDVVYAAKAIELKRRTLFIEVFYSGSMILRKVNTIQSLFKEYEKSKDESILTRIEAQLAENIDPNSKEIERRTTARTFELFSKSLTEDQRFGSFNQWNSKAGGDWMKLMSKNIESSFATNPKMANKAIKILKKKGAVNALEFLEKRDPYFALNTGAWSWFREDVNPKYGSQQDKIESLMRKYMKAQMEVFNERVFYPDANSTLRLSFGKVEGFSPVDGKTYVSSTYLDGVIEKYIPGDYEFDLPSKLIELYETKDYGAYADETGRVPVCFIASNHTTGGNSGSPALDAQGRLIGLNFDRVWEGTMSDINYDARICRNIMVDIRYVLFIVDKYAGATHLIEEMTLSKSVVKPRTMVEPLSTDSRL